MKKSNETKTLLINKTQISQVNLQSNQKPDMLEWLTTFGTNPTV